VQGEFALDGLKIIGSDFYEESKEAEQNPQNSTQTY
jgi:hypothetical protein